MCTSCSGYRKQEAAWCRSLAPTTTKVRRLGCLLIELPAGTTSVTGCLRLQRAARFCAKCSRDMPCKQLVPVSVAPQHTRVCMRSAPHTVEHKYPCSPLHCERWQSSLKTAATHGALGPPVVRAMPLTPSWHSASTVWYPPPLHVRSRQNIVPPR